MLGERRVRIAVHRDDRLGILHPDAMLDRPGDADGDVDRRPDRLPRLAHLDGVREPAGIDGGTGRGDCPSECGRELLEEGHALGSAQPAATGDDNQRLLDAGAAGDRIGPRDDAGTGSG